MLKVNLSNGGEVSSLQIQKHKTVMNGNFLAKLHVLNSQKLHVS